RWKAEPAAFAIVYGSATLALRLLALCVQFFRRAVARIRFSLAQQFQRGFTMPLDSIGLKVSLVGRTFVPLHPEPLQVREDFVERLLRRSFAIGVVDAHDELPAVVPRVKVGEQPRADVTDVQRAGRAGREARANPHMSLPLYRRGRLRRDVVNHAVDALDLVGDTAGDAREKYGVQ